MITLLTVLFVILCFFLGLFILIQQGKGDMGIGGLGMSTQLLFGGSGGQSFFEKSTWIMGAIFIFGSLSLAILKTKQATTSNLKTIHINKAIKTPPPVTPHSQGINQQPTDQTDKPTSTPQKKQNLNKTNQKTSKQTPKKNSQGNTKK